MNIKPKKRPLDKHVKSVHKPDDKDASFVCGTCKNVFIEQDDHNLHVKTHEGAMIGTLINYNAPADINIVDLLDRDISKCGIQV